MYNTAPNPICVVKPNMLQVVSFPYLAQYLVLDSLGNKNGAKEKLKDDTTSQIDKPNNNRSYGDKDNNTLLDEDDDVLVAGAGTAACLPLPPPLVFRDLYFFRFFLKYFLNITRYTIMELPTIDNTPEINATMDITCSC